MTMLLTYSETIMSVFYGLICLVCVWLAASEEKGNNSKQEG